MPDVGVEVDVDKSDIRKMDRTLEAWPKEGPRVLNRAINKTSDRARVLSVKKIAADTKLKQKALFQRGNWRRPFVQTRSSIFKLISTIRTLPHRIPLIHFNTKQAYKRQTKARKEAGLKRKKAGVSYDLGRGRATVPNAFFARVGWSSRASLRPVGEEGHLGVFVRKGLRQLPIRELKGPSISEVFAGDSDDIIDEAVALANEMLPKEVATQIDLVLKRKALRKSG